MRSLSHHIWLLVVETHFSHLYSKSHTFDHYPTPMTISEGSKIDQWVNWELCLSALLYFLKTHWIRACITADAAPIHLLISCSCYSTVMNKTLKTSPLGADISLQTWRMHAILFWLRTMVLYLEVVILIPVASNWQRRPHHLQIAEIWFWVHQTPSVPVLRNYVHKSYEHNQWQNPWQSPNKK